MALAFVKQVQLTPPDDGEAPRSGYPWELPAIRALAEGIELHPQVTYLIGENGSGKSTLLEAIAVAVGLNPEGGSSNFAFHTRESHSPLGTAMRLVRSGRRPCTDFFLRAESLFTAATYLDELQGEDTEALTAYGGRSLHEQSHGESFLAVMLDRFSPDGFYLLDEPEAALSTQNCLTCLRRIHELVGAGSQFVIATHSPIVLHTRMRRSTPSTRMGSSRSSMRTAPRCGWPGTSSHRGSGSCSGCSQIEALAATGRRRPRRLQGLP